MDNEKREFENAENEETVEKVNVSETDAEEITEDTSAPVPENETDDLQNVSAVEAEELPDDETETFDNNLADDTELADNTENDVFDQTEDISDETFETDENDISENDIDENDIDENGAAEGQLSEEELLALSQAKKKKIRKIVSIAAIVVVVLFIAGLVYSLCVRNGVGSKTVVNTSLPAQYSQMGEKLAEDEFDIKFENPFISLFGGSNADIITVDGYGVSSRVFDYFVQSDALNYEFELYQSGRIQDLSTFDWNAVDTETGLTNAEIAKGRAVESIAPILAVVAEGTKRGVAMTPEEEESLQAWVSQLEESYGENLEPSLKQSGYDDLDQLIEMQKLQKLYQKSYDVFMGNPLEIVQQYDDYEKVMSPDKITAQHILIMFPDGVTKDSTDEEKAETRQKAEEALAKAKAGEDFTALIETYNEDSGQGLYDYTFANDGSMVEEFTDAAFALEIGEISDIVESDYGYHIIKRTERIPEFEEYLELVQNNMKVRINSFKYSGIVVDADLSEYLGETVSDDSAEAESESAAAADSSQE